ncbi:hypothetical protein [Runella slithyformis]|uniref:Uncharacterized protein n=1 Tax=Runella slithyformis (strain ATCC 29530 / DSM 19594 / LMG 11500 / NCIMB 11436 / LSU 4) TaxID=761193 RepID=A0A7U3ZMS0_RUNSL|nr:hypothetical protein [Runella slithyformis]AEI50090.1 hypothetical protein Runsl_3732 [Runella slithyformis DSM 19594]
MNTLFIHIPLIGGLPAFCMGKVRDVRAVVRIEKVQQVSWLEDS